MATIRLQASEVPTHGVFSVSALILVFARYLISGPVCTNMEARRGSYIEHGSLVGPCSTSIVLWRSAYQVIIHSECTSTVSLFPPNVSVYTKHTFYTTNVIVEGIATRLKNSVLQPPSGRQFNLSIRTEQAEQESQESLKFCQWLQKVYHILL